MKNGAGAREECKECFARNQLLRIDDIECERDWWRSEYLRQEKVSHNVREQLKESELKRKNLEKRLEAILNIKKAEENSRSVDEKSDKVFHKENTDKTNKKRPGAKLGHPGISRVIPNHVDEEIDVVPEECPICGESLRDMKNSPAENHFVEDVLMGSVKVTNYRHPKKYCPRCKRPVRERHPNEIQYGRLGPGVIELAARLKCEMRLPWDILVNLIKKHYGLRVTDSALVQSFYRLSDKLEVCYTFINERIRKRKASSADETGWRLDGKNAYLWGVFTKDESFYKIDRHRSGNVIESIMGKEYGGVLGSDFYSAYNLIDCKKQRCLVHLQRDFHKEDETMDNNSDFQEFHKRFDELVRNGDKLKREKNEITKKEFKRRSNVLEKELDDLSNFEFPEKTLGNRLVKRIKKHRSEMLTFLYHDDVDYHNNLAERQLRPGVIIRKISYGSRSEKGARMFSIIKTVLETCKIQGTDFSKVCRGVLLENLSAKKLKKLIYKS